MRPIKITIKGLNSFREKVSIDFEELGKYGIFGIFGKTGSGKSTILDAMTFALYGIIARYGSKYGSCINENENEAGVELEFSIMENVPRRYKVMRSIRRKASGEYNSATASLVDVSSGNLPIADRAKEVTQKVEEIIGLNYEEFVKTVVLPQGSFKNFLVMEGAERRKILERIFSLEKYGKKISAVVKSEKAEVNSCMQELVGEIKALGDITDESLEKERQSISEEKEELRIINEKVIIYKKEAKDAERILEVRAKLEEVENLRRKLMKKNGDMQLLKEAQLKSEKSAKVVPLINELLEKTSELEEVVKALENAESLFDEAEKNAVKTEAEYRQAKDYYDAHYARGIERRTLLEGLESDWKKYEELGACEAGKTKEFERLGKERLEIEKSLSKMEHEKNKRDFDLAKMEEEINAAADFVKDEGKLITALNLYKNIDKNIALKADKEKELLKICDELTAINVKLSAKKEKLRLLKIAEKEFAVSLIRSELKKGDRCPVCGKTFEEESGSNTEVDLSVKEAENIKLKIEFLESEISNLKTERDTKGVGHEFAQNAIKVAEEENEDFQRELLQLYPKNEWKNLEESLYKVNEKKDRLTNLEASLKTLKAEIEGNLILLNDAQKNKTEVEKKYQVLEIEIDRLKKELKGTEEKFSKILNKIENPKSQKLKVEIALKKISDELARAEKQWEESKIKREDAKQNAGIEFTKSETLKKDVKRADERLGEAIWKYYEKDVSKLESEDAKSNLYRQIKSDYIDERAFEKNKETIAIYETDLTKVSVRIEELINQGKGESRSVLQLKEMIDESRAAQEKLEERKNQIAVLENELKNHERAFEIKCEKEERLQKLRKRAELLEILAKLFEAGKFAEYMAIENLKYISMQAGNTLKTITGGKYCLIADDDGTFKIRDFKNGGVIRSVKTMSGGETFVVSLSLALALSAQLQLKGRAPIELFFLDEGFGTLDDELLDVVMDSLERLANDRFKIGIVSHVEKLKQRMPIRLMVTPQEVGRGGSKVKIEYN